MDSVIQELLNNWGLEKIACQRSRRRKGKEGEGDWEEGKRRGGLGRRLLLEIKLMAFSRIRAVFI